MLCVTSETRVSCGLLDGAKVTVLLSFASLFKGSVVADALMTCVLEMSSMVEGDVHIGGIHREFRRRC